MVLLFGDCFGPNDTQKLKLYFVGLYRSELTAQVVSLKNGWFSSVALAGQSRTLTKEQLHQWRIYKNGLKHLWKLLRDADSLLPPTGRFLCAVDQLQNCVDDYQVSIKMYFTMQWGEKCFFLYKVWPWSLSNPPIKMWGDLLRSWRFHSSQTHRHWIRACVLPGARSLLFFTRLCTRNSSYGCGSTSAKDMSEWQSIPLCDSMQKLLLFA